MKNKNAGTGIGFWNALVLIFIVLKSFNLIAWSWGFIALIWFAPIILLIVILMLVGIFGGGSK